MRRWTTAEAARAAGWYVLLCACAISVIGLFVLIPPLWPLWVLLFGAVGWAMVATTVDFLRPK